MFCCYNIFPSAPFCFLLLLFMNWAQPRGTMDKRAFKTNNFSFMIYRCIQSRYKVILLSAEEELKVVHDKNNEDLTGK